MPDNVMEPVAPPPESPLSKLIPVFVDVETYMDDAVSLRSMTLRQYLKASHLLMMAVSVGFEDEPEVFYTEQYPGPAGCVMVGAALIQTLHKLARDPRYVFVAHNAAFDMRVLTIYLGIPHPINVWCTLEGSMGSWPEFPDGFKLSNLSEKLLGKAEAKFEVDLREFEAVRKKVLKKHFLGRRDVSTSVWESVVTITKAAKIPWDGEVLTMDLIAQVIAAYNVRDVVAMRGIYKLQILRLCAREQLVALRTHHQRRHFFTVDQVRLSELTDQLDLATTEAAAHAGEYLTEEQLRAVFNRENGSLRSVRSARLKKVLNASGTGAPVPQPKAKSKDVVMHTDEDNAFFTRGRTLELELVGEEFTSTSLKKISPLQMARNPNAAAILAQTSRANKMLSHKRRSGVFRGVDIVDTELGYARATTLRFSSPSCGRGLNLHNCVSVYSLILTDRGWVPITALNKEDLLWDGEAFVAYDQVTLEGQRSTMKVGPVELTPEHPVWTSEQRVAAIELTLSQQVQCVAVGLSSTLRGLLEARVPFDAMGAARKLYASFKASTSLWDAADALIAAHRAINPMSATKELFSSSASASTISATATPPSPTIPSSLSSMAQTLELACAPNGWLHQRPTTATSQHFLAGTISLCKLIASTTNSDTSPVTCGLLLHALTSATEGILSGYQPERLSQITVVGSGLNILPGTKCTARDVFDIRGVGPRARFVTNGVVTFNCPKHDVTIAKPVRKLFRLPEHLCFVRADLANVECRIESLLTGARVGIDMFDETRGGDLNADPYIQTWKAMTGVLIKNKKDPFRQVAKGCVLGLGFVMSATGYAKVLLSTLADKNSGVTEKTLRDLVVTNRWNLPDNDGVTNVIRALGCSQTVALSAYSIQRIFNETFPEYSKTAGWIVGIAADCARFGPGQIGVDACNQMIDSSYRMPAAPKRELINLTAFNDGLNDFSSLRVGCGFWPGTLTWREPKNRVIDFGDRRQALTIRKASGELKPFTRQLAIENVTQAAARNAMCMGVEKLETLGFKDVLHVHDEVLIIVERKRLAVLAARDALIQAFGPEHGMPWSWSILVKPDEITVTESLYEDEDDIAVTVTRKGDDGNVILDADGKPTKFPGPDRWGKIERDEIGCLANLP